jgi:hypothetical protein
VHDQLAGRVGDRAAGRGCPPDGHGRTARRLRGRAWVAGGAGTGGVQDRRSVLGTDQVDDHDMGAESPSVHTSSGAAYRSTV